MSDPLAGPAPLPFPRPPPGAPKVVVSWSSGKDSAFALYELRRRGEVEVVGLLTTVTKAFDRVSMHGTRREILERQARATRLPVEAVEIPSPCPNDVYERAMGEAVERMRANGVRQIAFGDLFLEDIRQYREEKLAGTGLTPIFPLWGRPTAELGRTIVRAGFDARIVSLDPRKIDRRFAGRRYDDALLDELPESVDPCAERGEFHTCVVGGPVLAEPIPVRPGSIVERDGFVFADLIPEGGTPG